VNFQKERGDAQRSSQIGRRAVGTVTACRGVDWQQPSGQILRQSPDAQVFQSAPKKGALNEKTPPSEPTSQ
jgi:hypothetical protein